MPHDCHSRARPISTANSAGCANDVCRNRSPALPPVSRSVANSTSSSGSGSRSATASAQRVTVSAKTGSVSNSSLAIPGYWLPCPVNNHAVVGRWVCSPRTTPGRNRFSARSVSAARVPSIESTTSAARCSKCDRPVPAVRHTSLSSASGWVLNQLS